MSYLIRNIPNHIWRSFKARCAEEGISIRQWLINSVTAYINKTNAHYYCAACGVKMGVVDYCVSPFCKECADKGHKALTQK